MRLLLAASWLFLCSVAYAQDSAPSRGAAPSADSAMFRGDAVHTGIYNAQGAATFHKVKWQFHAKAQIVSSPAVSGNMVYVGSNDHRLYALDLESGEKRWEFKTDGRVASSPAVSNGTVYFLSYDSNFYALDAATGSLKWKFKTAGERRFIAKHLHGIEPATEPVPDPFDFFLSSPVVAVGTVFFGSGDSNVYALDAASGGLKWKFKTGDVVHASPAFADGTVFVGSWDTFFYALDSATGKRNGVSKPVKTTKSTTRRDCRRRPPSRMAWCISDVAIRSFMLLTQSPENKFGHSATKARG